MKTVRKDTEVDKLVNMFEEIGDNFSLEEVYKVTGIPNYNSLKAFCSYIRKAKHIPDENRVDIRIRDNRCKRVL